MWSVKFGVRSVQCEVWSVEGRTRSGQVFLRTIGHLCLGNFRRRLARVCVTSMGLLLKTSWDFFCGSYAIPCYFYDLSMGFL